MKEKIKKQAIKMLLLYREIFRYAVIYSAIALLILILVCLFIRKTGLDTATRFSVTQNFEVFPIANADIDPCTLKDVVCDGEENKTHKTQENTSGELPQYSKKKLEDMIKETFPEDPETAVAVSKAESGLNTRAMGWNCRYNGISMACKPEDRNKAWSVDCGLMQINQIGQSCPKELFDPINNLKIARGKYDSRGWLPWSAWKNGKFMRYL